MNEVTRTFKNQEFGAVRTILIEGEPWFVLADVCRVLELSSPHKVADRLEEDERKQIPVMDSMGRKQLTEIISESGLYNVVLRSDKPNAKPFRKWVTSEVLPEIRKTGAYSQQKFMTQLEMIAGIAQASVEMERRQKELETKVDNLSNVISLNSENWRDETNKLLRQIAKANEWMISDVYAEAYELLEARAGCSLWKRLENKRYRMAENGASQTAVKQANRLDIISEDKKLTEIYLAIVKEMAVKYKAQRSV